MKPGTIIKFADGRLATIVYHGLDGYGIQWGVKSVDIKTIKATNPLFDNKPKDFEWEPEAMLREKSYESRCKIPCIDSDYEIEK